MNNETREIMMKKLYYTITLLAALLAWGCSETLEETYDEYTEGGMAI